MTDTAHEKLKVYCTSCNVRTEAKVLYTHTKQVVADRATDPIDCTYYISEYKFAACIHCDSPFLYERDYFEAPGDFSLQQGECLLYPDQHELIDKNIPETVRRAHSNAARSYTAALYEPCVVMCRKCLEAICYELGQKKGTLKNKLKKLQEEQVIDIKLVQWANSLRLIGNDAAHDLEVNIDQTDAFDSLQFIEAIILYIFSLNARYNEFKKRRDKPGQ
ncbi:MAG: DUF4145 domain-containing protein [Dethiobacteria bacterium]|nr:DUF4145 domain-containing protein [Dethiobacteria bacterium]